MIGEGTMLATYKELLQEVVPRPISSDREYKRALKQIGRLMRKARKTRAENDMIELLATLIEQFEIRQGYTDPVLSPKDRLAGLMQAREVSPSELSELANVPRTAINAFLGGRREISKTMAVRLAAFFGVTVDELIVTQAAIG